MPEVRLDQVLSRLPSGLPVPLGCWLVGRVAHAIAARPQAITPLEVRIRHDGEVRVRPPAGELPFAYRSPEVVRGAPGSPRSLVFTLGALLVETVTGRAPFARQSDLETRIAVAEETVPPLVGRVAQASATLDRIVERALSKNPEERVGSPIELARMLDDFLDEELHDVDREQLAKVVRAALGGVDLWMALRQKERPNERPSSSAPQPCEQAGSRAWRPASLRVDARKEHVSFTNAELEVPPACPHPRLGARRPSTWTSCDWPTRCNGSRVPGSRTRRSRTSARRPPRDAAESRWTSWTSMSGS